MPSEPSTTAGAAARPRRRGRAARPRETILVVEDDDGVRAYTVDALRELGYRVLEAADGASALAAARQARRTIDLLFTDVVMPGGMNGRQLADEALRRGPD